MNPVTRQGHEDSSCDELNAEVDGISAHGSVRGAARPSSGEAIPAIAVSRTVGAVVACFDLQRMRLLMQAIQSVLEQDYPSELTVVVDHNEELYLRLLSELPENVSVIRNTRSRGAAGARNTAALASDCGLVAFLDDDARARPGWLRSLVCAMDEPGVVGVGGRIIPGWQEGRPRWFPPEFGWVVGASIANDSAKAFPVRNVWAGSMLVDREAFQAVNGFRESLSKVGGASQPEDTELCLRISHAYGAAGRWLMVPSALVEHHVPMHRTTLRYVMDRCWSEGTGKVRLRAIADDRKQALADERRYLSRTVPRAVGAGVLQSLRSRNPDGLMRSGTLLLGIGAAMLGALTAGIRVARTRNSREKKTTGRGEL